MKKLQLSHRVDPDRQTGLFPAYAPVANGRDASNRPGLF